MGLLDGHLLVVGAMDHQQRARQLLDDPLEGELARELAQLHGIVDSEHPGHLERWGGVSAGGLQVGGDAEQVVKRAPGDARGQPRLESGGPGSEVPAHADPGDGDAFGIDLVSRQQMIDTRRRGGLHVRSGRQAVQAQGAAGSGLIAQQHCHAAGGDLADAHEVQHFLGDIEAVEHDQARHRSPRRCASRDEQRRQRRPVNEGHLDELDGVATPLHTLLEAPQRRCVASAP